MQAWVVKRSRRPGSRAVELEFKYQKKPVRETKHLSSAPAETLKIYAMRRVRLYIISSSRSGSMTAFGTYLCQHLSKMVPTSDETKSERTFNEHHPWFIEPLRAKSLSWLDIRFFLEVGDFRALVGRSFRICHLRYHLPANVIASRTYQKRVCRL